MDDAVRPLVGGRVNAGVARVGETVRRTISGDRTFQHNLLAHLEQRGFAGLPTISLPADAAGKPLADPKTPLRLAQQQQTPVRELVAAFEIDCELLTKKRIVIHGGVACGQDAKHSSGNELLRDPRDLRQNPPVQFSPLMHRYRLGAGRRPVSVALRPRSTPTDQR